MHTEKTIDALNELVEINNDRIVGYQTALKETEDTDLHKLFTNFLLTSEQNNTSLKSEIFKLNNEPETGTKNTGKLHRLWMDFKALVTNNNRASILSSCEFGDDTALKTYEDVLNSNLENLSASHQNMISEQMADIRKEYTQIVNLKEQTA